MESEKMLCDFNFFSEKQINKLHEHWIETAEQFISVSKTREGYSCLQSLLEFNAAELEKVIREIESFLTPETLCLLNKNIPERKLGAIIESKTQEEGD